jgi:hypothetical protein
MTDTRPESPATSTARLLDEYAAHLRSLPAEPFPLATDAPRAPPVRVRVLEPLPFPLVRVVRQGLDFWFEPKARR